MIEGERDNYYEKNQTYFFNSTSRRTHFGAKLVQKNDEIGPSCTWYKPKYQMIDRGNKSASMSVTHL